MANLQQKITYAVYKAELDTIYAKSKNIRIMLLKKARTYTILSNLISYPVKLLLGVVIGSGGIELFTTPASGMASATAMLVNENNFYWLKILRMIFEIMALVLTITRDFFQFETQIEKFYAASLAVDTFCNSVKYESFLQEGNEGNRYEILLMYKKLYEEMVSNNKIIQTVENVSPSTPPDVVRVARQSDMESASSDPDLEAQDDTPRRISLNEDRNRIFYLHAMLDRMPT